MSGEIKCAEEEVKTALSELETLIQKLSSAKDALNGIDTSGLELATLNVSTVCTNIQNSINSINAITGSIIQIIAEMNAAENDNVNIIKGILLGAIKGVKYIADNATTLSFMLKNDISLQGINAKFTGNGVELWKENVKYTVKFEKVYVEGNGYFRCFIMEPENPEANIPTAFILDGHGPNAVQSTDNDYWVDVIGTRRDQKIMLTAINNGGLERPNARFVYLPNNGTYWDSREAITFDKIVENLTQNYNIDVNNMSLIGHSSRRKSSCRICNEIKIYN